MFYQIADYQGVVAGIGEPAPFIVVPRGRCNLVVHDEGPSPDQDVNGLGVFDLTDHLKKGAGACLEYLQRKLKAPQDIGMLAVLISNAISMGLGKKKRLIAIASNAVGHSSLNIGQSLIDVLVRDRKTVTLSFGYYKYIGTQEKMVNKWAEMGGALDSKTHSRYAIDQANRYFVPQANIAFELKAARDLPTDAWPKTNLNNPNLMYPAFDHDSGVLWANTYPDTSGADFRVFFVPTVGGGALGFELPPEMLKTMRAVFVPWKFFASQRNPKSSNPNADLLVPTLCHELVHAVSGSVDHSSRAGVMCNDHLDPNDWPEDELLIDSDTLKRINPF